MGYRLVVTACAIALAWTGAARAQTAPFTVDDLLEQESLGNLRISPDSRWVIVERVAPWDRAATYDLGQYTAQLLTGLEIHDVQGSGPPRTISDRDHGTGYISGPFSPDGSQMVVYRLTPQTFRIGVMHLQTAAIRWFDVTPEWPNIGQTVAWRSDDELIIIARPDDDLPVGMQHGRQAQSKATRLWAEAAAGHQPTGVVMTSGKGRDDRAQARQGSLVRLDVPTGAIEKLATGEFFDFSLSPDRRSVAAMWLAGDIQPDLGDMVFTGTPARRRRLSVFALDARTDWSRQQTGDFLPFLMAWSPDSRRLLAYRRSDGVTWTDGGFALVDRAGASTVLSRDARPVIDVNGSQIPFARGAWDGDTPVGLVEKRDGTRVWRNLGSSPNATGVTAAAGQVLAAPDGRLIVGLGADWRNTDGRPAGHRPERAFPAARAQDLGGRAAINPDPQSVAAWAGLDRSGCLVRQTGSARGSCFGSGIDTTGIAAVSPDLRYFLRVTMSPTGSTTLGLTSDAGEKTLTTLNSALDSRQWGDIRPIHHTAPDGSPLVSWLLVPPGVEARNLPVIAIIYPGTVYPTPPAWLRPGSERRHINPAVLAAAGYAVLIPSLPLYDNSGHALDDLAPRLEAILDVVAGTGVIDPERMAVIGHSYGGYAAMSLATRTTRYKAIVASAGRSDFSDLLELSPQYALSPENGPTFNVGMGWAETGQGRMGTSLLADPQRYVDASPIYRAIHVETPVLIIDGDMDFSRGRGLFGALYRMNREAGLATYAGEGHVFVSPANIRDLHSRIIAWLDRYLSAGPPQASLPVAGPALQDGR